MAKSIHITDKQLVRIISGVVEEKMTTVIDERLDERFIRIDARFDEITQQIHEAINDVYAVISEPFHDHERRIKRLEKRTA